MTADVCVGVAAVAGRQGYKEWFARTDVHEQVRVIGHTEVGAAVAKTGRGVVSVCVYEYMRVLSPKMPHTRGQPTMWIRLSWTLNGGGNSAMNSKIRASSERSSSMVHIDNVPAHSEESEPGGKSVD